MLTEFDDLNLDELFHLIGCYNNYVMNFDYERDVYPVCVYEFYEYEYQEILELLKDED